MHDSKHILAEFICGRFPMPREKATAITDLFSHATFNRNDLLLKERKVCSEYHFLCDGFMRAWTTDLEGRDITTAFYPEKNVVCELFSFFKRIPSRENIQALTNCTTLFITYNDLQVVFHTMPEFREFGRSILIDAYAGLKQRMLSTLHETADQRYKNLIDAAPEIFQHASLKNIASYLGITDSSLSRIRKEFAKENTIH
jgi:CRP-like cAMP-binding protein